MGTFMNHYIKCNVGVNTGLIYTMTTKQKAMEVGKTIERRFGGAIVDGMPTWEYGNDRDGFVDVYKNKTYVKWLSGKPL